MTPGIDERREAAERLREIPSKGFGLVMLCDAVNAEHEGETYSAFVRGFVNRLADLIEPEPERTCRNIAGEPFAGYREFDCSECGSHLEVDGDTDANLLVGGERPMPNYCPNCGAKVEVGK